ncbi:MAG: DUF3301 domain-containing protein [Oleibacter sp.]|nr:DUF3301 domain-containing protein [Thalassolituus sp.]
MELLVGIVILSVAMMLWPLWKNERKARTLVIGRLKKECQQQGLQLLDETVLLDTWRVRWGSSRPIIKRSFLFEFSATGGDRYQGEVTLNHWTLGPIQLEVHRVPSN